MVKRLGGARRKTRHQLKKEYRKKGKISLKNYFQKFKKGEKVIIKPEPSYQKGFCHKRYFNKTVVVNKKQGDCYEVSLKINQKQKKLIVHPIHLVKA